MFSIKNFWKHQNIMVYIQIWYNFIISFMNPVNILNYFFVNYYGLFLHKWRFYNHIKRKF